jgi:hypothetical protein
VQGALSLLPDRKDDMPANHSGQAGFDNIGSSLGIARFIGQSKERVSSSKLLLAPMMKHKQTDFKLVITDDEL